MYTENNHEFAREKIPSRRKRARRTVLLPLRAAGFVHCSTMGVEGTADEARDAIARRRLLSILPLLKENS